MKRVLFLISVFFFCFSAWPQTKTVGELIEFRIREYNYTKSFNSDVLITTGTKDEIKYLDIELTQLDNSVDFSGDTVGWNLYNNSNDASWKTSKKKKYIPISNYVFLENTSIGKKLYFFQEGINSGRYNTNVVIILLPHSFTL